jgi:lipopolysaccharide export system permease protein
VTADEGYMVYSKLSKAMVFTLFEGEYHELDNENAEEYRFSVFSKNRVNIPAPEFEFENREDDYRGDREMNVEMMLEKVRGNRNSLVKEKKRLNEKIEKSWQSVAHKLNEYKSLETAVESDYELFTHISKDLKKKSIDRAYRKIARLYQVSKTSGSRISSHEVSMNRYLVEIHKKFSIPFASIVFILIGAPLGIASRKGSMGVGITLSIFFFLLYWIFLILGEDLADRRLLPPMLAMWFPNILIGSAGVYLTWRTVKETTVIKWEKIGKFFIRFSEENRKKNKELAKAK